jgi:hypothetical protein
MNHPSHIILSSLLASLALGVVAEDTAECGLWLGPSHIKDKEEHGFGLGMYTGRRIPEGEILPPEVFVPVFDFEGEDHPPLREYLWSGEEHKNLVLEVYGNMLFFSPGLAAIAPCTSTNYNLERLDEVSFDNAGVHRSRNATAGAFTYYQLAMFQAVRDIEPGEELTVACEDDDFDAGEYEALRFLPKNENFICLDDKLEERSQSNIPGIGRGVFAKKDLAKDTRVLSSPAAPLDRKLTEMPSLDPVGIQLLLNYAYGHPDSDLLWLPYGKLINSINHFGAAPNTPNVKVVWHSDPPNEGLSRRKEYHHPQLLDYSAERVALTHGKGLLMDLVATRDIKKGEELYLDYGKSWVDAWTFHEQKWKTLAPKVKDSATYTPAAEYNRLYGGEPVRTITEQHRNPYAHNILTACRFQQDWIDDEFAEDYDMIQYQSWLTQEDHDNCLLPCIILERLQDEESDETIYTAKLVDHHHQNESIEYACHIFRRFEYIDTDSPRRAIGTCSTTHRALLEGPRIAKDLTVALFSSRFFAEFIDNVYSTDVFLPPAFRQPIEMSDYPEAWMKQKVRRRTTSHIIPSEEKEEEHQFKRKNIEPKYDKEDIQRKKMASPRTDL